MAQTFIYMRPDEITSRDAGVTQAVQADHLAAWLCDGRVARPCRSSGTGLSATIVPSPAGEVGLVAVCNHNLDAAKVVTFGGDITATVTCGATLPPDSIPLNPYTTITPVAGVDNITVSLSGNASNVAIGEIICGKYRTLTKPKLMSDSRGEMDYTRRQDVDLASIHPYDPALSSRAPWSGTFVLTTSELDNVIAWFHAQRNGTRESLIAPTTNDAWVGFLQAPKYKPIGPALWRVELTFEEIPRTRWT